MQDSHHQPNLHFNLVAASHSTLYMPNQHL
jgi:hypothetical protein